MRSWLLSILFTLCVVYCQSPTATITGEVKDPSGAAVGQVKVTARDIATNITRSTLTNAVGQYTIPLLQPGSYELTAEAPGFKREIQSNILMQVSQELGLNFTLQLGSTREVVDVKAEALQTSTESASSGTVIDNRKVVELPLNGRQFYGLALLSPGAYAPAQGSTVGYRGGFNVAGAAETNNNFTVNGVDNNDTGINGPSFLPSIDSIQEFKLLTGIYPAEYGRSSGGQVIVITKSGTNGFHGSLFEFVRNQVFDAVNYFTPAGTNPGFKRNQFGGTVGGPIKRNKTFFFTNYEGLRLRQQISALGTVPLTPMLSGDFSSLLALKSPVKLVNPFTGVAIPGNIIQPTMISSLGAKIMSYYPAANLPTTAGTQPASNYNFSETRVETMNEYSMKIDHQFSERDSLSASYNHYSDPSFEPSNSLCGSAVLPGFGCNAGLTTQLGTISETRVFTPSLLNEVRAGTNWLLQPRVQEDINLGFPGLPGAYLGSAPSNATNEGVPSTTITGYSRLGGATNLPSRRSDVTYQFLDNLSWTKGRHTLKFGGEFRDFLSSNNQSSGGRGSLTFSASSSAPTSGYALADLLLGVPTSTSRSPSQPFFYNRLKAFNWFIQDDYKITSNLTLNIGLRWEFNGPMTEKYNQTSSFDPSTGGLRILGQNGVGKYLYNTDLNNFAPRFGFAWQPFHDGKTVVRGGYGIFYNQTTTLNGMYTLNLNPPFRNPQTFNASKAVPITLDNPYPAALATGSSTAVGISQYFPVAYSQQWSMSIQRQLTSNLLLDVSYFGSKGTDLPTSRNINQPPPGPGTTAQVNARRPFPNWGNITFYEEAGNASFNSLQTKLEKRLSGGLSFLAAYTYGKSIDNAPGTASTSAASGTLQNSYNRAAERGLSDFDVRHRLVLSPVWNIPLHAQKQFTNQIVSGWEVSGIFTYQTGRPFTPTLSGNISNTLQNADRPNVVGDPFAVNQTVQTWFNVAAFAVPVTGTFGNAGRNILHGPGLVNLDFTLSRNFLIAEKLRLQFRAESFNIANHPNFNYPSAVINTATAGQITSALDPRQIQLALKLSF